MNVNVIIPAAGIGQRMGAAGAKQYLPIHGKAMLQHTLDAFIKHPRVSAIIVPIHHEDKEWGGIQYDSSVIKVEGGKERCDSVLKGLDALAERGVKDNAWVMVHDAARPCISQTDISRLIEAVKHHPLGGLLGSPVVDTVKHVNEGVVTATVDRSHLWRALTPQMFRFGVLYRALQKVMLDGAVVSDEAMAIEKYGTIEKYSDNTGPSLMPLMIEGSSRNIKVTYPQDLALAEQYLQEIV